MIYTTTNFDILGRVLLGVLCTIFALSLMAFVLYRKRHNKLKIWYKPIGINKIDPILKKEPLLKTDYKWFLLACIIFIIYWFSAYLIPSLLFLSRFTSVFGGSIANANGVVIFYNPSLVTTGNTVGGFSMGYFDNSNYLNINNIITSDITFNSIGSLDIIMKQTNVSYYLYYLEFYKIYDALVQNNKTLEAQHMVDMFYRKVEFNNPSEIFSYGLTQLKTIEGFNFANFNQDLQKSLFLWLHSWVYSNVLLTPLCQAFGLLVPLSIIFSTKKDYASFFAPWGLLGGTVTLFGGIVAEDSIHVSVAFVFYDEQIFFLYHFFIFTMGLVWISYNHRYTIKRILYLFIPITTYVIYILITSHIFNIHYFTTGMTALDLTVGGSYVIVQEVLANAPLVNSFPSNTSLMIFVFVGSLLIILSIKNLIHTIMCKKLKIEDNIKFIDDAKVFIHNDLKYFFSKKFYLDKYKKIKEKYLG